MKNFPKATLYEIFTPSDPGGPGTPDDPGVRQDPGESRGAPGTLRSHIATHAGIFGFFIIPTPGDIYDEMKPKASSQYHEYPKCRDIQHLVSQLPSASLPRLPSPALRPLHGSVP
jgi:hypothetical protein